MNLISRRVLFKKTLGELLGKQPKPKFMAQIAPIFGQCVDNALIEIPEAARLGAVFLQHDMGDANNDILRGGQFFQRLGFGKGLADINAGV